MSLAVAAASLLQVLDAGVSIAANMLGVLGSLFILYNRPRTASSPNILPSGAALIAASKTPCESLSKLSVYAP